MLTGIPTYPYPDNYSFRACLEFCFAFNPEGGGAQHVFKRVSWQDPPWGWFLHGLRPRGPTEVELVMKGLRSMMMLTLLFMVTKAWLPPQRHQQKLSQSKRFAEIMSLLIVPPDSRSKTRTPTTASSAQGPQVLHQTRLLFVHQH